VNRNVIATWLLAAFAAGLVPGFARAQDAGETPAAADSGRTGARAPLAIPDDFAPAVDLTPAPAVAPPADDGDSGPAPAVSATAARPAAGRPQAVIDTLDLGTTSITGNQELPKVLYIVPWKSSDLGDLAGRPVNTLLDEVLAPIDPEVFDRQLSYFDSLYGTTGKE